jgi:hypothetical protein
MDAACAAQEEGVNMYQIDLDKKVFKKIDSTFHKNEKMMEKYHLQQYIFNSWELFKNDIGYPGAILLGQELKPHDSVQDSIDLLAFDQNTSCLIVIELKRDKNKLQLLQALSYAAMVATWDSDKLISSVKNKDITSEALDFIKNYETNQNVKIVLIAEYYDPEVILTCDWLSTNYGLDISIFSVQLHKVENKVFLDIDQKYPLPELSETYESRRKVTQNINNQNDISWEDIIPNLKYPFAKNGIDLCRRLKGEGDPKRRRFIHVIRGYGHFELISFNFREKYLNIYVNCKEKNECTNTIHSVIGNHIEITEWRDGINFNIDNNDDYNKFTTWLKV